MLPAFRENWEIQVAMTNALLASAIANLPCCPLMRYALNAVIGKT